MNIKLIDTCIMLHKGLSSSYHWISLCLRLTICLSASISVPLIPSLVSPQWLQALSSAIVAVMANGDLGETILSVRTQRRMGFFR